MKCVMLFLVALLVLGCKEEKHPKIEIYLLKQRQPFVNTIPFKETSKYKEIEYNRAKNIFEDTRFDTLIKEVIFAGQFIADSIDLQSQPFITDVEIKAFEKHNNSVVLDSKAARRIYELSPEKNFGQQFVITVDKEPKVSGYFWNTNSAISCRWYYIECLNPTNDYRNNTNDKSFPVFIGNYNRKITLTGLYRHKELIAAFEETHRLVK